MTEPSAPDVRGSKKRTRTLVVVVLAVFVVAFATWWLAGSYFAPLAVKDLLSANTELNPVEATSELCAEMGCVEGWRTDIGSYLRFEHVGQAEYWATVLGDDARRNKDTVLDLREVENTFDQRRQAVDILFSQHDWY